MKLWVLTIILLIVGCTLPDFGLNPLQEANYTVKVTWLGHAGFSLESKDVRIYINPYSSPVGALKGDGIIVTYSASDICDLPSIRQLSKDDSVVLVPPECNARLSMSQATSLTINNYYNVNQAVIQTIDAYYPNGTINKGEGAGLIITMNGVKIYYAGITGIIPEMDKVKDVDLAIVPIAGGGLTMSMIEAIGLLIRLNATYNVPMYYGGNTGTSLDVGREFKRIAGQNGVNITLLDNQDLKILK